jgi:hypothetical protein
VGGRVGILVTLTMIGAAVIFARGRWTIRRSPGSLGIAGGLRGRFAGPAKTQALNCNSQCMSKVRRWLRSPSIQRPGLRTMSAGWNQYWIESARPGASIKAAFMPSAPCD